MPELSTNSKMIFIASNSREKRAHYFWSYLIENFYDLNKKILVITSFKNFHFQRIIGKIKGIKTILSNTDVLWIPPMHLSFSSLLQRLDKEWIDNYDVICFYDFSAYDLVFLSKEKFDLIRIMTLLIIYFNQLGSITDINFIFTAPVSSKQKIWAIIDKKFIENKNIKHIFLTGSENEDSEFGN